MIIDSEINQPHIGYFEDINKIVELSHVYYHKMSNSYELRFKNHILSLRSLIFSQQDMILNFYIDVNAQRVSKILFTKDKGKDNVKLKDLIPLLSDVKFRILLTRLIVKARLRRISMISYNITTKVETTFYQYKTNNIIDYTEF